MVISSPGSISLTNDAPTLLDAITDAEANIAADQLNPVGTLTISAPVLFGQRYVAPLINAFALRYPDVSINAVYADRTTRLLEEGVDIAIRVGHLGDSSTFAVPLGFVRRRTYAAPSYLARHGEPLHPRDLVHHHCVSFTGVSAPLEWFPRLLRATPAQRANWRLIGRGVGIHWEDVDEDISVRSLLAS